MNKQVTIKENKQILLPVLWLGKEEKIDYMVNLEGKGAEVTLLILLLGKGEKKVNLKTNIYHKHADTKSRVIIKGVLADRSSVDYNGLVKVVRGANGVNTSLAAHLLLLSQDASGKAVPCMEIEENEVKAGHAVTVGKVNDLELFYLMSRGLSKETATQLIVQGFLESLLAEFPEKMAFKVKKEIKGINI